MPVSTAIAAMITTSTPEQTLLAAVARQFPDLSPAKELMAIKERQEKVWLDSIGRTPPLTCEEFVGSDPTATK